jgi:hypothetical protein
LFALGVAAPAAADAERCAARFPEAEWTTVVVDAPVTVATAGMVPAMAERFGSDVERIAGDIQAEIGGLADTAVCLATPEVNLDAGELVAFGQRLHAVAFGAEQLFAVSAVEIRMVDDAIAFGLPHVALHQVADELGLSAGYPEPLASTIAHWYLARTNGRLDRYHSELVVALFLDDPNPQERTPAQATPWVAGVAEDPLLFDPQFVASQMGAFIEYAVANRGSEVLRDPTQETWAALETDWRVALRDELLEGREGSWGAEWGVAIFVGVLLLAIALALHRRWQKRRAARRRPTPPPDEHLFASAADRSIDSNL